ncbi:DUF2007 domain-containing protein [Olivibacter sp. SDN3]|uniref:putative signal transducing protein n=1 Tax=Olivibacter sp. SDN3 TaxID=2764720 RepID=UPI00165139FC|nr:DUF2007 domain-containing protein [Olivibacter sp. SDN3]QNL51120.1 DUF2007 domain-containing protein [Olivibacter sp. SDN3]
MEKGWKKIFSSTDFFKTEMIRQALIENNIQAVIINKQDSSYRFGQVELYVSGEHEEDAVTIVKEMIGGE